MVLIFSHGEGLSRLQLLKINANNKMQTHINKNIEPNFNDYVKVMGDCINVCMVYK